MLEINKVGFEIEGEWNDGFMRDMSEMFRFSFHGDGSVRTCTDDELKKAPKVRKHSSLIPYEANSIPYKVESIESVKGAFDEMEKAWKDGYFHTNASAGFHIHVSFKTFPAEILSARFYAYFIEKLRRKFPEVVKTRSTNRYCRVSTAITKEAKTLLKKTVVYDGSLSDADAIPWGGFDRYNAINMRPSWNERQTVEFRIFPSAEPSKMWEMLVFTIYEIQRFIEVDTHIIKFMATLDNSPMRTKSEKVVVSLKKDGSEKIKAGEMDTEFQVGDIVRFVHDTTNKMARSNNWVASRYFDRRIIFSHGDTVLKEPYFRYFAEVIDVSVNGEWVFVKWYDKSGGEEDERGRYLQLTTETKFLMLERRASGVHDVEIKLQTNTAGQNQNHEVCAITVQAGARKVGVEIEKICGCCHLYTAGVYPILCGCHRCDCCGKCTGDTVVCSREDSPARCQCDWCDGCERCLDHDWCRCDDDNEE